MNKYNRNMGKRAYGPTNAATTYAPRPADFPLGSLESRVAARALIKTKEEDGILRSIQIILVSPDGTEEEGPLINVPPVERFQY